MKLLTINNKDELLDRAKYFLHSKVYLPDKEEYVRALRHKPVGTSLYRANELEPIIDHEGLYDLDDEDAWVTVNHYNALVLNSWNMLIADIDFGDQRLNRFAGVKDCDEVLANMKELQLLDNDLHPFENLLSDDDIRFAEQSYRIYRTHSGCRVICTSTPIRWDWQAERFMRFLRSDPKYITLCDDQGCYRARLTPKPWRERSEPVHVCTLEGVHGDENVHDDLAEQIRLHDEMTLGNGKSSCLA